MDTSLVKRFIEIYKPDDNLKKTDSEILEFGNKMLPEEIIYLWEQYGFGNYGNGIIKVIDKIIITNDRSVIIISCLDKFKLILFMIIYIRTHIQ